MNLTLDLQSQADYFLTFIFGCIYDIDWIYNLHVDFIVFDATDLAVVHDTSLDLNG